MLVGRISTIRTQRGSVTGMSLTGRHHSSWCTAGIVYSGALDDDVGRPVAVALGLPVQFLGDQRLGVGKSAGLPFGAP